MPDKDAEPEFLEAPGADSGAGTAAEIFARSCADDPSMMASGGAIFFELGRWGDEVQIRVSQDDAEAMEPGGEVLWRTPYTSADDIEAGFAEFFVIAIRAMREIGVSYFDCNERAYAAWRTREERAGRAPWTRRSTTRIARHAPVIAAVRNCPAAQVDSVFVHSPPADDGEREIWWDAALLDQGLMWDGRQRLIVAA